MAVVNSSLVVLSILLTIISSMTFEASSLPLLHHTALTYSLSDNSSTLCVPYYSSLNRSLCLMSENIDSRERDETKEVRLETSDGPRGDSGAQFVVMAIMFITLIFFGVKILNFVLLPVTTIIIMIVIVVFRL